MKHYILVKNDDTLSGKSAPDLIHSCDSDDGIARVRRGKGFSYHLPNGEKVECEKQLARIAALGLPPAYRDVWICADAKGHLQATGIDDDDRKQYRYHANWTEYRSQQKFGELAEFGARLPRVRRKVTALLRSGDENDDSDGAAVSKERAIAAVIRIIDRSAIRIGGDSEKARGATTLKTGDVAIAGGAVQLSFTGKGGAKIEEEFRDQTLMAVLEEIDDLPGKRLFQYEGRSGELHPVDSGDVNQWLKSASGLESASAKMFRSWRGSTAALHAISKAEKPTIKIACEAAADVLNNTADICRTSYIHPAVIGLTELDDAARAAIFSADINGKTGLRQMENRLLALLTSG